MKKRWVFFFGVCGVCLFIFGLAMGHNQASQEEAPVYASRAIAVVNMDMGTTAATGERLNYATAIINTLGEEYQLVSPAMAYSGYSAGDYAAILTFPADLSAKILSFNSQRPEKVALEFLVNPSLPETDYLNVYTGLLNLQLSLNATISRMYITSIYEEFHAAQDEIEDIFQNDQETLNALGAVQLHDFTESLELGDIPQPEYVPKEMDIASYIAEVRSLADEISTQYLDSYARAKADYDLLRLQVENKTLYIQQQADEWLFRLAQWTAGQSTYGAELNQYAADLSGYDAGLVIWRADLSVWHDNLAMFHVDLSAWNNALTLWYGDMQSWATENDAYIQALEEYANDLAAYADALRAYWEEFSEDAAALAEALTQWNEDIMAYAADFEDARALISDAIDEYNTDLMANADAMNDYGDALTAWSDDLSAYAGSLPSLADAIAALPPMPQAADYPADEDGYNAALSAWQAAITAFGNGLSAYAADVPELEDGVALPPPMENETLDSIDIGDPPEAPDIEIPDSFDIAGPGELTATEPDIPALTAPPMYPSTASVLPQPVGEGAAFTGLAPAPPAEMGQVPESPDLRQALNELEPLLATYNAESYLTESVTSTVNALISDYGGHLQKLELDFDQLQTNNLLLLKEAYSDYNMYVYELRSSAMAANSAAQGDLERILSQFFAVAEENSTENRQSLSSFSRRLPSSRTNGVVNQELVDFTATPMQVALSSPTTPLGVAQPRREQDIWRLVWILLPVLAFVFALTFVSVRVSKRKERRVQHRAR